MNKAERMGGPYHPYLPDALADYELLLSPSCASAVADAQEALARLELSGSRIDTEPLARMMLRAEAVSSSRIEGLEMPAGKLLEYEELDRLGVDHRLDGTEAQILGNLHTLVDGLARAVAGSPLTVEEVCELNRVLLTGTRLAERGGVIRAEQNWIGGNRVNPVGAAYVPPSPDAVPALMEDLVAFANHSELPPIATAAIAHAQLETIHPFADGNGRAGRALVHLILKKGGTTRVTVPPISLLLATDRERYIANLAAFRFEGDDETERREAVNGWVEYFARTTCEACSRASAFEERRDVEPAKLARFKLQQQKAASFGNDLNQIGLAFVHHHPALFIEHRIPHATTAYRKGSIRNAASPSLMSFQSASSSS